MNDEVIPLCAALAVQRNGDARYALDLLSTAAAFVKKKFERQLHKKMYGVLNGLQKCLYCGGKLFDYHRIRRCCSKAYTAKRKNSRQLRFVGNSTFSMELLLIEEEEVRRYDGMGGWRRRGWVTEERRLLRVVEQRRLNAPSDMFALLPDTLDEPFSVADVAAAIEKPRRFPRKWSTACG